MWTGQEPVGIVEAIRVLTRVKGMDVSTADEPSAQAELELRFDHNVIEHLGIKLYQNKPVNVLAELVANCWDADAKHVWIDFRSHGGEAFATVADDGSGMTLATLRERYLVIGKAKRATPKETSPGGRRPMGRKGIGKLAPFGVARLVDVVTVSEGVMSWFTLSLDDLLKLGRDGGEHRYRPVFHVKAGVAEPFSLGQSASSALPEVQRFLRRMRKVPVGNRSGTLIAMHGLTANALPDRERIVSGLGSRFSVVLVRNDFRVRVSKVLIDERQALPPFDYRIPAVGFADGKAGDRPIRWWAGFVLKADWPADQAGVGVFAHGKIAQDRPFFFGAKGKEIYQRYLYAVVEADWLDELDHDLVSTDRTSIDWSDAEASDLLEWGRKEVGTWLEQYTQWRSTLLEGEVQTTATTMRTSGRIHVFSDVENRARSRVERTRRPERGQARPRGRRPPTQGRHGGTLPAGLPSRATCARITCVANTASSKWGRHRRSAEPHEQRAGCRPRNRRRSPA